MALRNEEIWGIAPSAICWGVQEASDGCHRHDFSPCWKEVGPNFRRRGCYQHCWLLENVETVSARAVHALREMPPQAEAVG